MLFRTVLDYATCSMVSMLQGALVVVAAPLLQEPLRPEWCRQLPRPQYSKLERIALGPASQNGWFEVYKIRPGVFAIYEPRQFEEVISYLILGQKRALLFDTGLGVGSMRRVARALTRLPVVVLNSHTHFDHIGSNAEFREILGVDSAYTRGNAGGGAADELREMLKSERLCGALPKGVELNRLSVRRFQITRVIHDGERINLGGRELEVLFTPGHAPDALCLLDRPNRLLWTGDSFYPGPIYLFVPETDFAAYTASATRLAALAQQVDLLLPSHNLPAADPENLTRLAQAVRAVQEGTTKPVEAEGRVEYTFQGFSLLLSPEAARQARARK